MSPLRVGLEGARGEPGRAGACGHWGPGHGGILFGFMGMAKGLLVEARPPFLQPLVPGPGCVRSLGGP